MDEVRNMAEIAEDGRENDTPNAPEAEGELPEEVEALKKRVEEAEAKLKDKEKELSKAIGQKVKAKLTAKEEAEKLVSEILAEKELKSLNIGDDLKKDLEALKQIKGYETYKEAMEDPIIKSKMEESEKKKRAEEASLGNESSGKSDLNLKGKDLASLFGGRMPDVNNDEEDALYEKWKKANGI